MRELEASVEEAMDTAFKRLPKVTHLKSENLPKDTARPDAASDQLAMACHGMLKIEAEFIQLAQEIVGEMKIDEQDRSNPSDKGPLIPRLRSDAELLARLAIRMHRLMEEVRSRL